MPEHQTNKIAILMGEVALPHLRALYQSFDGDLLLALILGELANRSLSLLFEHPDPQQPSLDEWLCLPPQEQARYLRPCNAYSLAEATGIPRETVRRKIKKLLAKGWVIEGPGRLLTITPKPAAEFYPLYMGLHRRCEAALATLQTGVPYRRQLVN